MQRILDFKKDTKGSNSKKSFIFQPSFEVDQKGKVV